MQIQNDKDAYHHLKWMRNKSHSDSGGLYGYCARILNDGDFEKHFVNLYIQLLDTYLYREKQSALKEIIDYFEPRYLAEMFGDNEEVIHMNELYSKYDRIAHKWKYETVVYDANTRTTTITQHTPEQIRKYQSITEDQYMGRLPI